MKRSLLVLGCVFSLSVFAGKEDREFKKNEFDPAIKAATEAFKKASGCDLKVEIVGKDFELKDNMNHAKWIFENIKDEVGAYCLDKETQKPDADSMKAVCKLKTLKVQMGSDAAFEFKDSTGTSTVNKNGGYIGFANMMEKIDI